MSEGPMSEPFDGKSEAAKLPTRPGVYLMKDKKAEVIYVGKAKKLKSRVTSYFNKSAKSPKTLLLVNHIHAIDFIINDYCLYHIIYSFRI